VSAPAVKPGRGKAPPLGSGSCTTEASVQAKRRNQVAAAARRVELRLPADPVEPSRRPMQSVSVSKATGDRIAAAARARGCSMQDVVRAACAAILGPSDR
jgi:hypothetical protein